MKKTEDLILKYLDGQMSLQEKSDFEKELNQSNELRDSLDQYKSILFSIDFAKNVKMNKDYASSIIPEFRRRIENKKSVRLNIRYAYVIGIFLIVTAAAIMFQQFNSENLAEREAFVVNDLTQIEIDLLLDQMNSEEIIVAYESEMTANLDSLYTAHYSDEIIFSDLAEENLFALNGIDLREIEYILSEEEMELVYNQIINKVLF